MNFVLAGMDVRLLSRDGYGPLEHASEMLLQRELHSSDNLELRLAPEVNKPKFQPCYFKARESDVLLVLSKSIDTDTYRFLKFAESGISDVGDFGKFVIYDLKKIESYLLQIINFERSEFQMVELHFDRDIAPSVLRVINDVSSYDDVKALRKSNPYKKIVPSKLFLKEFWGAFFFQFFTHTFVNLDISLTDTGFVPEGVACETLGQ